MPRQHTVGILPHFQKIERADEMNALRENIHWALMTTCHLRLKPFTIPQFQNSARSLNKNRKKLSRWCHEAGFSGVAGLCRELGISRQTAYDAVTTPDQFPVAAPKIFKALNLEFNGGAR